MITRELHARAPTSLTASRRRVLRTRTRSQMDPAPFKLPHTNPTKWGDFDCLGFYPSSPRPKSGLVVLSDVFGMSTEHTREQLLRFRDEGWTCVLPDLYRGRPHPLPMDRFTPAQREAWRNEYAAPYERVVDIAFACRDFLLAHKGCERVGVVGYCYGGGRLTEVLADARARGFETGVAFYGTRIDPHVVAEMAAPALFIFGATDHLVPPELVEEITGNAEKSGSRVVVFEKRGHGFVHQPKEEDHQDGKVAMDMALAWLKQHMATEA